MREGNKNAKKSVDNHEVAPWFSWEITDRAERCIRFIETYLILPKGHGANRRMKLAQWQKDWLRGVLAAGIKSAVISLPRGNGKSTFLAAIAIWALFDHEDDVGTPSIPIIATTVNQAIRSVYSVATQMIAKEPELASRSIKYSAIGAQKMFVPYNDGEMFPMSSDVDGLQGLDFTLAVCDEIGFQSVESWNSLLMASGKRPRSLCVGIGTPGLDRINALFLLRKKIKEGAIIPGFVFTEYAADHGTKVDDETQWKKANPALAEGYMDRDALVALLTQSPEAHFRIFRLGQWVDGVESWLGPDGRAIWKARRFNYQLVDNAPTWIGIDVGIKRDSTAVALVQYKPDGVLHCKVKLWVPTKEEPVNLDLVVQYIRDMCDRYKVGAVSYDPKFFDYPAAMLHNEGIPMIEINQSIERMTPIIGHMYDLLMHEGITVDEDDAFEEHALNAIPKYSDRGFTLQKAKSRGKIDAIIAASLAVDRAFNRKKPKAPLIVL